MSSLQKFHRRTNNAPSGPVTWPATAIGKGGTVNGFWISGAASNKLILSPRSTEVNGSSGRTGYPWGSEGTFRGTTNTTNGLANTNTLASFGSSAHPAAYYAKNLTTGGYNTWYLPAKNELNTCWSNHALTPFASANAFNSSVSYWSSTESSSVNAWLQNFSSGLQYGNYAKTFNIKVRPVRRV
jgi:hypothetical protein